MKTARLASLVAPLVVGAVVAGAAPAAAKNPGHHGPVSGPHAAACGPTVAGFARCHADAVADAQGAPLATGGPSGYWPSDLQSAYKLGASSGSPGSGPTIAIVDAYDDPKAESDLGVYRAQFGLGSCTTANGCFRKVDQNGGTAYPRRDAGWAQEISLDVDMASATCPNCKVVLVEAASNRFSDLARAVDTAAGLGASAISNSYGGGEYSGEVADQSHYNHPGIAVTVSSGDSGYRVEFPAASQFVTAVGGTRLVRNASTRGWAETTWSGAGSGCSAYVAKPSWQNDTSCSRRTVADVAAVADPNTGVAVYDSFRAGGWLVFGGTSVAAPVVAGVYALAGNAATLTYGSSLYGSSSLFDVTGGSNGSCGGSYLCTAGTGYDGPTGNGTPNGTGAF